MAAPKGTPDAIVKKLDAAFRRAVNTPEFRTTAESFFVYEPNLLSGQQMKELIENLYKKNGEVIKAANLGK